MKHLILSLLSFGLITSTALALDYENHLGFGLNIDTYKADLPSGQELNNDISFAPTIGLKSLALWGNVGFRTGAFLEWKSVDVDIAGGEDVDLTAYYASIPLNLQFNLNEKWAIYGGLNPRVLLAKTCEQCGTFDDDSMVLVNYSNAGINYRFGERFNMDFIFNHALGDNFENLKINTAQVLFMWEL
jgi:hypothetical protein